MIRQQIISRRATAATRYWTAQDKRAEQMAYHEMLLFGGPDGYRFGWRSIIARWLRYLACRIES